MPDVGMAEHQMSRQRRVIRACEKWWPLTGPHGLPNRADCSGFVKSVAQELGIELYGDANAIFTAIHHAPWSALGTGDAAAHLAAVAATNGSFVVGAWRHPSGGHGHVGVVVDTNHSSATVPQRTRAIAYWGAFGAEGQRYAKHSSSWGATKRPDVFFAAREL